MVNKNTSWGGEAKWYEGTVSNEDSYQNLVIMPNLLRLLNIRRGEKVLDVACGSGFFAREFTAQGAKVTGLDIGRPLIEIAKRKDPNSEYMVGNAEKMDAVKSATLDAVTVVLALQNIKNLSAAVAEISRVLKPSGRCLIVLNHPVFRIPGKSDWGFDSQRGVQFRRLDAYMSEFNKVMEMHPGKNSLSKTVSFHRPLQIYFKAFAKSGLRVSRMEEWVSPKASDKGPRKKAEDLARKEFPLFMCLELVK